MQSQYFSPKEKFEAKAEGGPQHQRDSDHPARCSTSSIQLSLQNVRRQKSRCLLGGFATFFVSVTSIFAIRDSRKLPCPTTQEPSWQAQWHPLSWGRAPFPQRGTGTCAQPGEGRSETRQEPMAPDFPRLDCEGTTAQGFLCLDPCSEAPTGAAILLLYQD